MVFSQLLNAWNKTNRWLRVTSLILLLQFGGLPQRKPGYYCNDPALSHQFTGDTISWKLLLFISFAAPLILMFSVEKYCRIVGGCSKEHDQEFFTKEVLLQLFKEYSFGLLLNIALVQMLKVLVGEPRPHFFDVCQPDVQCEGSEFVDNYKCVNSLYSYIKKADAGRSFPSGHTSIAIYTCIFMVWYLQSKKKIISNSSNFTIFVTQTLLVISGILCGISRITDRRHHWWDVLAGAVIGVATIVCTIRYLCRHIELSNPSTLIYLETRTADESREILKNDHN